MRIVHHLVAFVQMSTRSQVCDAFQLFATLGIGARGASRPKEQLECVSFTVLVGLPAHVGDAHTAKRHGRVLRL